MDASLDVSLRSVVDRILPCAEFYICVRQYSVEASRYEAGLVSHALAATLQLLLGKVFSRFYLLLMISSVC